MYIHQVSVYCVYISVDPEKAHGVDSNTADGDGLAVIVDIDFRALAIDSTGEIFSDLLVRCDSLVSERREGVSHIFIEKSRLRK